MSLPAPGIFGCLGRTITTAKTSECRTKRSAELGRRVPKVLLHTAHIITPPILPALTVRTHTVPIPLTLPARIARILILLILQVIPARILTVLIARPLLVRLICSVPAAMIWAALTSTVLWTNMLSMAVHR